MMNNSRATEVIGAGSSGIYRPETTGIEVKELKVISRDIKTLAEPREGILSNRLTPLVAKRMPESCRTMFGQELSAKPFINVNATHCFR